MEKTKIKCVSKEQFIQATGDNGLIASFNGYLRGFDKDSSLIITPDYIKNTSSKKICN